MIWLLLTFFAWAEVEEIAPQSDLPINELANRGVSTIVESHIVRQFADVPQIAKCLEDSNNVVSENDLNSGTADEVKKKVRTAQVNASACIKKELDNVDPAELEKMSENLGLRDFGLVKGTGSQAVVNFFTGRFEGIFYTFKNGVKDKKKVVDQALFFDIYESQLGKSVLLELSNYCLNQLDMNPQPTPPDRAAYFRSLAGPGAPSDIDRFTDTREPPGPPNPSATGAGTPPTPPNQNQIYEQFLSDVLEAAPNDTLNPETTKNKLKKVYENCAAKIPPFCKNYQKCLCQFNKKVATAKRLVDLPTCTGLSPTENYERLCTSGNTVSITIDTSPATPPILEPNRGRNSCHVEARLRGYRGNLTAVNEQQRILSQEYVAGTLIERDKKDGVILEDNVYVGGEKSIDEMTSITSNEIESIVFDENFSDECAQDPTKENCKDFSYGADEAARFANTAASYAATTAIEVKKLKNIENDNDKLIAFLKSKGYLDLVSKVEGGNFSDIVDEAAQRYETQREATFGELSKAFERKQLVGNDTERREKVLTIQNDLKNKKDDFKQLMLFNNVVTSYLTVQKKDSQGDFQDAGSNTRGLQRELQGNNQALQGLAGLASDSSQLGNNDSPIVDQSFIQGILGEETTPFGQPSRPR